MQSAIADLLVFVVFTVLLTSCDCKNRLIGALIYLSGVDPLPVLAAKTPCVGKCSKVACTNLRRD